MSPMLQILLVATGTYLLRVSMVLALGRFNLPAVLQRALRLVAPAVLAALVAQTLLLDDGNLRAWSSWYPAAVVAGATAAITKSTAWTLAGGFASVWVMSAIA